MVTHSVPVCGPNMFRCICSCHLPKMHQHAIHENIIWIKSRNHTYNHQYITVPCAARVHTSNEASSWSEDSSVKRNPSANSQTPSPQRTGNEATSPSGRPHGFSSENTPIDTAFDDDDTEKSTRQKNREKKKKKKKKGDIIFKLFRPQPYYIV